MIDVTDIDPNAGKSPDATEAFRKAIDAAFTTRRGPVFVPAGKYALKSLQLRNGVKVIGEGRGVTTLSALPSAEAAFITLENGPVQYSGLEGMTLIGGAPLSATNVGQSCMKLIASPPAAKGKTGGMWWAAFREIDIEHFDRGIELIGGYDNYFLPHQFLSFRDINLWLPSSSTGPALRLEGQVNQVLLEQIHLDTRGAPDSTMVEIVQSLSRVTRPELISMNVVTVQNAKLGLRVDGAQNVSVKSCWFENLKGAIAASAASVGIQINGCRFANAGVPVIAMEKGATFEIKSNVFAGALSKGGGTVAADNIFIWGALP